MEKIKCWMCGKEIEAIRKGGFYYVRYQAFMLFP